ncbi:hypothetical protein [uncultured Chryseobacterium sp.]|uniref:hypothetical protein n=1 Tax=uncultured Chryseobacterium sp. TaxID=259322 RepID=UPI0025F126DA|nr:hypothetical protein [uncultured Chryseobacterium sp.]
MEGLYFFIGGFILIFIFGNIFIYFLNKDKHRRFFNFIRDRKYDVIKNVEAEIKGYSKLGAKISYRKGNIVFLEDEIFIISLNKPIIQLTKDQENFPGVFCKFCYDFKAKVKQRLEIKNSNGSIKVNLNFKNTGFDLENYLKKHI